MTRVEQTPTNGIEMTTEEKPHDALTARGLLIDDPTPVVTR